MIVQKLKPPRAENPGKLMYIKKDSNPQIQDSTSASEDGLQNQQKKMSRE